MRSNSKTQVRFFQAKRDGSGKAVVGPPNVRTVQELGLKNKGDTRIGFKVKGTVIFAKRRPNSPGALNDKWDSIIDRSKSRKLASEAVVVRLEKSVNQLPAAERTAEVTDSLNVVKAQLMDEGTVAAKDLQSHFDSIANAKTIAAANKARRQLDANVKDAAAALFSHQASIQELAALPVTPQLTQTSISEFLTFVTNTATLDLDVARIDPLAYQQAFAFAKKWTDASPKHALGEPEDRYVIDRLAKLVLEGCKSATDVEPQGVPQFSCIDEQTLQRAGDSARFVRDDSVKFGIGGFGSISAYKCGAESIVVKELIQEELDPNLSPEKKAEALNALTQKALAEVRVHTQASQGATHIVGIHGTVSTPDGRVLLILEHAPNGESGTVRANLDKAVKGGELDPQDSFRAKMLMFVDMLKGADEAHRNGVMHLDLKPENYFVDKEGRMKLGDFGTSHGVLSDFGKPGIASLDYTAPEINLPNAVCPMTYMSDTWSLACIGYEIFSPRGIQPQFGATTLRAFPYENSMKGRESIDDFVRKTPEERYKQLRLDTSGRNQPFHQLIMAMLDPDPSKRPSLKNVLEHPLIAPYANPQKPGDAAIVAHARQTILAYARPAGT